MLGTRIMVTLAAFILAGATVLDVSAPPPGASIIRHFTPADRVTGRYQYVPLEIPPGTRALRVSYHYDRANGDNVIDLGLFEPGSLELGTTAFRGYSGGARTSVILSDESTTPGYRPGPLPPGRWHVLLGLYKIRNSGVDVTIDVETSAAGLPAVAHGDNSARAGAGAAGLPAVARRDNTGRAEAGRWLMGALHTHTLHSDGTVGPLELLRQFREKNFDFVAITDHNNTTHRYELTSQYDARNSPLWIVGEEVTTPSGHANVWGLDDGEWIDFRVRAEDRRIGELVRTARRYGALFGINHPASECVGCGWEHEIVDDIAAIEISNGRHGEVERALAIWDKLLLAGRRITGVGSSDWHNAPNPIDVANVRVFATALSESAILEAIRAGRVIVMNGAAHATPEIAVRADGKSARIGDSLSVGAERLIAIEVNAQRLSRGRITVVTNGKPDPPVTLDDRGQARLERPADTGYVRFELSAADGSLVAITNPVYLVRQ